MYMYVHTCIHIYIYIYTYVYIWTVKGERPPCALSVRGGPAALGDAAEERRGIRNKESTKMTISYYGT